ncbi:uncharacterized protein LOC109412164 [Aedes albopictus]|uniref:PHD-type domain-containing protein n=1 Tax=Aedes albopictus TaxID=7160 RepID=A0ABM1ZBQ5_AEDAL|nr:histone deacetylase complex subunit CTI6-like [Aedes albopictus]
MPSGGVIKSGVKSDKGARPKETVVGEQSAGGGGNPEVVVVDETMEGHTCKTCRGPDTEDMVQCDRCDGWFHFSCVGVSEEVTDKSWSCTNCVTAKWIQRTKTALEESALHRKENIDQRSTRSQPVGNIATSTRVNPVILPASVSQKPTSSVQLPTDAVEQTRLDQQKHQSAPPVDSNGAGIGIPRDVEKALSEISVSSSQKSAVQRAKLQLMRLEEERLFQQQQDERRRAAEERAAQEHREFLDKKYRLLEEVVSERSSRSRSDTSSRVNDWVQTASQVQQIEPDMDGSRNDIPPRNVELVHTTGQFGQQRIRFEPSAQTGSAYNVQTAQQFTHRLPNQQFRSPGQPSFSRFTNNQRGLPMQTNQVDHQVGPSIGCPSQPNLTPTRTVDHQSFVTCTNRGVSSQQHASQTNRLAFNSTTFDGPVQVPPACSTGVHHRGSICASQGTYQEDCQDEFHFLVHK